MDSGAKRFLLLVCLGRDQRRGTPLVPRAHVVPGWSYSSLLLRQVFQNGLTETRFNWSMEYAAEMAVKIWALLLRGYVRRFKL